MSRNPLTDETLARVEACKEFSEQVRENEPDYSCNGTEVASYSNRPSDACDLSIEALDWAIAEIRRFYISEPIPDPGMDLVLAIRDVARGS